MKINKSILSFIACLSFVSLANAQGPNDAAVLEIVLNDMYPAGSAQYDIGIKFTNAGNNIINPLTFNWTKDGGVTVYSWTVPFNITPGMTLTLAHNQKISFANPGSFTDVKVWTSMPNNVPDGNTSNDTLVRSVFVNNGFTTPRNVLVEEFTTAPCGYCPDGALVLEAILAQNPTVIGVGIHDGFGTDAMTIPEHTMLADDFTNAAPTAVIDRTYFTGETEVAISRSIWGSKVNLRKTVPALVDIAINGQLNIPASSGNVTLSANFVDYALPGDIRIGLYVVEDSVDNVGAGYNQTNYYNTTAGHPYFGAGNPIVGYIHRNVVRDVFPSGTPWGDNTVIPNSPTPGSSYSVNYPITLHPSWDLNKLYLVAYVAEYSSSVRERQILNASKIKLLDIITGINESKSALETLEIYPNPTSDISHLKFYLKESNLVSVSLHDLTGKLLKTEHFGQMSKGNQLIDLDVQNLSNGIYFVSLKIGNQSVLRKISISK